MSVNLNNKANVLSYSFYHGSLDGIACEQILRGKPTGTFLVRDAEKTNSFYLSWVESAEQKHCGHIPFILSEKNWIRFNCDIGKAQELSQLIPQMMHRPSNACYPLDKNV